MSILPMLRASEIIRTLEKAGFTVVRQSGSHMQLRHRDDPERHATVAMHSRDISRKNLRSILRQAKISVPEFLHLLKN
ncbi:MAG TPA: type II toxin-antitoxin system HicA family toxin [Candidatus Paceibacterota bacterium]